MPNENRSKYNTVIANRTRTLTSHSTQMEHASMSTSHVVHLKITHKVETTMLCITHTGDGKITDTTTTQHHFEHHIQTMISRTLTTGGQPGKAIGFVTLTHMSIPTMSFTHVTIVKITNNHHKMLCPQLLEALC